MRNAALFAFLAALVIAALFGWLAYPIVVGVAVIAAAVIGRATSARGKSIGGRAESNRSAVLHSADDVAPGSALRAPSTGEIARNDRREIEALLSVIASSASAVALMLWRVDHAAEMLRPVAAVGRDLAGVRTLRGDPLAWVAREGTPLRLEPSPAWALDDTRVVATRLWQREHRDWILTFEMPVPASQNVDALDTISAPLRLLIDLQERRTESDADRLRLHQLLDILHRIPVATELSAAAGELLSACMQLTGATGGAVGLWDGERGRVVCVHGDDGGPSENAEFVSPTSEMALAIRADEPLIRENGSWKPGATQMADASDRWRARPRSFAAIPLQTSSATTGVVAVWSSTEQTLDVNGIELIRTVAPYAALHLQHARDYGQLKETAETDPLTGLRNRRAFDAALALESSRFERYARPLSLLLIDLDHFKAVNDTYGHEAGDDVLRKVAELVRQCVRDVDTAARFGGEEIAVLLPETPLLAARDVAERIRVSVASATFGSRGVPIRLTASLGVSSVPESAADPTVLVARSDEALYIAKADGRNRVVVSTAGRK